MAEKVPDEKNATGTALVEVTVAKGQSIIADPKGPLGKGTRYLEGQRCQVMEKDIPLLIRRGVINRPQTEATPLVAEPPPLKQPVPKVTIETAG